MKDVNVKDDDDDGGGGRELRFDFVLCGVRGRCGMIVGVVDVLGGEVYGGVLCV